MTAHQEFSPALPRDVRLVRGAVLTLAGAVTVLSALGVAHVLGSRQDFPGWFPPLFGAGTAVFLFLAAGILGRSLPALAQGGFQGGAAAHAAWLLVVASWICTSSVHQFYPFRPGSFSFIAQDPTQMMAFNGILAWVGFLGSLGLWVAYARGARVHSFLGLILVALVALVPNDDCANGFNERWIAWLGASPLMYLPNALAVLFATGALTGTAPRLSLCAVAASCAGSLFLGLGHYLRFIW